MAGERALPDLRSKIVIDSSSLKKVEAEAAASGGGLSGIFGGLSGSAKNVTKDLEGMGHETAKGIPILGQLGGAIGGLPLPLLGVAAAAGLLVVGGKAVVDISEKWEASQKSLKQATDATGASNSQARDFIEGFISTNKRFVSNQAEVVDSYATLTRQGMSQKQVHQDLNLALDLSTLKHISLKDATEALVKVEMGKGKALVDLGIAMKDYPVMMETQHQADLKVAAAEALVEKATLAHTAAVKAHGEHSTQAHAASVALAAAQAKLAEAHDYAAKRAAASTEIHDLLEKKLKGGRDTTSDLTQVQNQLSNTFQTFAEKVGPGLTAMLVVLEKVLLTVVTAILNAITTMTSWHGLWDVLGKIMSVVATVIQTELMVAFTIVKTEIEIIITVVQTLWQAFQDVVGAVKDVIQFLGQIKVPSINLPFGIGGPSGRASGGPVLPGGIYTVGERGPETLLMGGGGGGGTIIPGGGGRSSGGGGGVTVVVQGFVGNPNELFQVFREGIRRLDRAQT